ncbi:hypothetical protein, partial [Colwellia sp. MB02u-6]|uniref:hypothetical protein n=1 Tax=Colwellia sp. MB02u-6 TaxID=2759824 RepID=UPI001C70DFC0
TEVQPTSNLDQGHIQPKYSLGQFFCRSDFSLTTVKRLIMLIDQQTSVAGIMLLNRFYVENG